MEENIDISSVESLEELLELLKEDLLQTLHRMQTSIYNGNEKDMMKEFIRANTLQNRINRLILIMNNKNGIKLIDKFGDNCRTEEDLEFNNLLFKFYL